MDDYISRESALAFQNELEPVMCKSVHSGGIYSATRDDDLVRFLSAIPAADVVPVRHSSWIEDGYYDEPCVCSNCGEPCKDTVMGKPRWNYCPNCGARMDLKDGDGE